MTARAGAIRAIVFDAYGTIFDVQSVARLADTFFPGDGAALAALWRTKQIDYTRLRTLSDRYERFSKVTEDALVHAAKALGLGLDDAIRTALLRQYDHLAVFADAADALLVLKGRRLPMAILSNADPPMLEAIVDNAGLAGVFHHLLSVDGVGRFKPARECYALGPSTFGCDARELLFVSSNGWDAAGAAWFGYTTFWINRADAPVEELGIVPTGQGRTMHDALSFALPLLARAA